MVDENMNAPPNQPDTAKDESTTVAAAKRPVDESTDTNDEPSKRARSNDTVIDVAVRLGLNAGDRLQVAWEIDSEIRWWGATLLEHDGREDEGVAVRTLEYDAFPPDFQASREDVVFLHDKLLMNYPSQDELEFRREGQEEEYDDDEAVCVDREEIETVVDRVLAKALQNNSTAWNRLTPAQQASVADVVAAKKEKLTQLLLEHTGRVITSTDMKAIIQRTMEG